MAAGCQSLARALSIQYDHPPAVINLGTAVMRGVSFRQIENALRMNNISISERHKIYLEVVTQIIAIYGSQNGTDLFEVEEFLNEILSSHPNFENQCWRAIRAILHARRGNRNLLEQVRLAGLIHKDWQLISFKSKYIILKGINTL
jgi:hypothetical protein